jgi:2-polyprenyl-3-methyl-5-hydroxy-6-metoxy-1,4-benzoquinol methylase
MKEKYHDYVFKNNKFVGKFEEMYQNEEKEGYCSWYQDDMKDLGYQISLIILSQYNFDSILDIGCGEGMFTSLLKKKNNSVSGIDVSPTAIKKAEARFKDIEFFVGDINKDVVLKHYDLVVIKEVLSYIENWREVLKNVANISKYVFVSLDLPEKPNGFIRSFIELEAEMILYCEFITKVEITTTGKQILILGKVRK